MRPMWCAAGTCSLTRSVHVTQAVLNYTTTAATLLGHFTFRLADKVSSAWSCWIVCILAHLAQATPCSGCNCASGHIELCDRSVQRNTSSTSCMPCLLQMGGAEGVRAAEIGNLTLQLRGGLHMHCVPRATL